MSYGLTAMPLFAEVGAIYINFGLWAVSIYPAWCVIRHFGASFQNTQQVRGDTGGSRRGQMVSKLG